MKQKEFYQYDNTKDKTMMTKWIFTLQKKND